MTITAETKTATVLVVDDDRTILHLLTRFLTLEHYGVLTAADANEALHALEADHPDIMLLDVVLGDDDGLELLERVRKEHSTVPIILLTGKSSESDRVMGLKLGADDYVVKPFSPAEVEARIASVLRRTRPNDGPVLAYEGLTISTATREVRVNDVPVQLTAKEFDLLTFLASSPRQVFSREQLLDRVWNSSSQWQSEDTVTEHIRRLRKRIEVNPNKPRWLATVWGVGYRFNP